MRKTKGEFGLFFGLLLIVLYTPLGLGANSAALQPPAWLAAVPGDHQVALTWPAVPAAGAYRVYRGFTPGGEYSLAASLPAGSADQPLTYTDTGLINRAVYFYVVTAAAAGGPGAAGESGFSPETAAVPGPPVSNVTLTLNGAPARYPRGSDAPVTAAIEYALAQWNELVSPDEWVLGEIRSGAPEVPPAQWTGRAAGRPNSLAAYPGRYRIQAEILPGCPAGAAADYFLPALSTDRGRTWTFYTPQGAPIVHPDQAQPPASLFSLTCSPPVLSSPPAQPGQPALLSAAGQSITLTWPDTNIPAGLLGFDIYRSTAPGGPPVLAGRVTPQPPYTFTDRGLPPNTTFYYTVRAVNAGYQYSPASPVLAAATTGAPLIPVTVIAHLLPAVPQPAAVYVHRTDGSAPPIPLPCDAAARTCQATIQVEQGNNVPFFITRGSLVTPWTLPDGRTPPPTMILPAYANAVIRPTVYEWDDPLVIAHTPATSTAGVNTPVSITWNQPMPAATRFSVDEISGTGAQMRFTPVTGRFTLSPDRRTLVFTPDQPLKPDHPYRVRVAGQPDLTGVPQQVPFEWIFTARSHQVMLPLLLR